jgi:hypothetical protein
MVFSLHPKEKFFESAGVNEMYINISHEQFLIGGGGEGPAFIMDADLFKCSTLACETFGSRPLLEEKHFSAKLVELYSLS